MAEIVEKRIEETIPEVEEMERMGLLTNEEVRKLIMKRKDFEYRVSRRIKKKHDFLNYINFEKGLLELLSIRRQKVNLFEKKQTIETPIKYRCMRRLKVLTGLWPFDLDTWEERLKFATFAEMKEERGIIYRQRCRFHMNNVSVWIAYAKFELEVNKNFYNARKILLSEASRHHPKSIALKREIFRLELLFVASLDNPNNRYDVVNENFEKVKNCAVAEAVYRHALKTIPEAELCMQFYQVASKFAFASNLREKIFSDLVEMFPDAECLYKIKAIRALECLPVDIPNQVEEDDASKAAASETIEETIKSLEITEKEAENTEEEMPLQFELDFSGEVDANPTAEELLGTTEQSTEEAGPSKSGMEFTGQNSLQVTAEEPAADPTPAEDESKDDDTVELKLGRVLAVFDEALRKLGENFVKCYLEELLPLLYDCWGQKTLHTTIIEKIYELCEENKSSLSPLHFYLWYQVGKWQSCPVEKQYDILRSAVQSYPEEVHLHLELIKFMVQENYPKEAVIKEFNGIADAARGEHGLELWETVEEFIKDKDERSSFYRRAFGHQCSSVSRGMKIRNLQRIAKEDGILMARELYKKQNWEPPFCSKYHAIMAELELAQEPADSKKIRYIFDNAILQHGKHYPGVWIAYVMFEKCLGKKMNVGALVTKAESELGAEQASIFREFLFALRELQGENTSGDDEKGLIEESETTVSEDLEASIRESLVKIKQRNRTLKKMDTLARRKFFTCIQKMTKALDEGHIKETEENGREWEKVLEMLSGEKVVLSVKCSANKTQTDKPKAKKKKKEKIQLEVGDDIKVVTKDPLEEVLKKSETLQPDFMKQKVVTPYHVNKRTMKNRKMIEKEKSAGDGWYNMKAPELTEEVKRDLKVLQMRSVLDPKRHYKKRDMQILPKHFHIGRIEDSPFDYYSSRIPKKERKRTLAEEIMNDEETLRYQKRRIAEIREEENKLQRIRYKNKDKNKDGKKNGKGKGPGKFKGGKKAAGKAGGRSKRD